jgi:hypothetical protein
MLIARAHRVSYEGVEGIDVDRHARGDREGETVDHDRREAGEVGRAQVVTELAARLAALERVEDRLPCSGVEVMRFCWNSGSCRSFTSVSISTLSQLGSVAAPAVLAVGGLAAASVLLRNRAPADLPGMPNVAHG